MTNRFYETNQTSKICKPQPNSTNCKVCSFANQNVGKEEQSNDYESNRVR